LRGVPKADRDLLAELAALYRDVDAAHEGASCSLSTECCRFGITGREPYVTSIELLAIERALARRGGPLAPKRRALPLVPGSRDERPCPLLGVDGRCAVYADRPFGCRTFFCRRATLLSKPTRAEEKDFVARLRIIASRHVAGGDAPRPLSRAIE
jgi:Fe-S-cluster containining protein